jgi:hypothetical protein
MHTAVDDAREPVQFIAAELAMPDCSRQLALIAGALGLFVAAAVRRRAAQRAE